MVCYPSAFYLGTSAPLPCPHPPPALSPPRPWQRQRQLCSGLWQHWRQAPSSSAGDSSVRAWKLAGDTLYPVLTQPSENSSAKLTSLCSTTWAETLWKHIYNLATSSGIRVTYPHFAKFQALAQINSCLILPWKPQSHFYWNCLPLSSSQKKMERERINPRPSLGKRRFSLDKQHGTMLAVTESRSLKQELPGRGNCKHCYQPCLQCAAPRKGGKCINGKNHFMQPEKLDACLGVSGSHPPPSIVGFPSLLLTAVLFLLCSSLSSPIRSQMPVLGDICIWDSLVFCSFLLILLIFISEKMKRFAQLSWEYLGFILKKGYEKEANLQIHVILTTLTIMILSFIGQFM